MVSGVKFDADEPAVELSGGDQRRAGTAEGVQHQVGGYGKTLNQGLRIDTGFWVGWNSMRS